MFAFGFTVLWPSANNLFAQSEVYSSSECSCLDNATSTTNGQYAESITINGIAGQTWRLMNAIGFYNPLSSPPPASPILYLNNTIIPETAPGSGVYTIEGLRVSGLPWTVTLTNGSVVHVLSASNSCAYPTTAQKTISGDTYVCQVSTESYTFPSGEYSNLTWALDGGGTIVSSTSGTVASGTAVNCTVDWGGNPGTYYLKVSGIRRSYIGQTQGCEFDAILPITIFSKADVSIDGDFGNCVGTTETYTIPLSLSQLYTASVQWQITTDEFGLNPAAFTGSGSANSWTVTWPSTPGVYYLHVSGNAIVGNNACTFADVRRIDIVSEANLRMACNNLVQVSMNPNCELSFRPQQFYADPIYPESSFDIMIRDLETDTIIPNGTIGYGYINKTVEVKIIHECSGNSCWSYAKIEDKSILDLVCPDDVTIQCNDLGDFSVTGMPEFPEGTIVTSLTTTPQTWLLMGYDKCSDVILAYSDEAITDLCDGPYSSVITRTWTVTDENGNSSDCEQQIFVERASIIDVQFPLNYDSATGPFASLEACGTWEKVPYIKNGLEQSFTLGGKVYLDSVPSPDFAGWPSGTLCLKSAVSYTDTKLPICDNNPLAYKLIRRWTVIDHCTGEIRHQNQFITVMDTQAPLIDVEQNYSSPICFYTLNEEPGVPAGTPKASVAILNTKEHTCYGDSWTVKTPYLLRDCGLNAPGVTWYVKFKTGTDCNDPGENVEFKTIEGETAVLGTPGSSNYRIENLPLGRSWIRYYAEDLCGNIGFVTVEIDVVDNQPPTPVCDKNSVVAIPSDGMAFAGVLTFDDGSHDNCTLDYLKVRRMDNAVAWSTLSENNEIKFTCSDVNKTVTVELAVWDTNGASNSCMVDAKVQDNILPTLTVPGTASTNCYSDLTNLSRFGSATAADNCSVTVRDSIVRDLNECNVGSIERWFIATDPFGNRVKKRQLIKVGNDSPLEYGDINWPDTYTTNSSCVANLKPENLSSAYSKPTIDGYAQCTQIAMNYEDIVFNFADNVCVKILRKWTVIDWCQRNGFDPDSGTFTNTQLIMVNNVDGPDIKKGCNNADLAITQVGECKANVKVTAVADDDCTPEEDLKWTYTIDFNNDGVIDITNGSGKTINRDFDYGTHKITWRVEDACKNSSTCSNIFTLEDTKKPTPYCISEIVTVIMPQTKSVTIWASDFDKGATDNCSKGTQITASFSGTNRSDISRTITCADLAGESSKEFTYDVYAIDAKGNYDFCTVKLRVQDNDSSCSDPVIDQKHTISGLVTDIKDIPLKGIELELDAQLPEYPRTMVTSIDGTYTFDEMEAGQNYSIRPIKNNDVLNGVSTLDLVYIQRHILGVEEFSSSAQLIAADVNNSQSVTVADLSDIRKTILGIYSAFPKTESWRFLPASTQMDVLSNPYSVANNKNIPNLSTDLQNVDFKGIKMGDVNASATTDFTDNTETRSSKALIANHIFNPSTRQLEVIVEAEQNLEILGMQMELVFNANELTLVDIEALNMPVSQDHVNFTNAKDGSLLMSWNAKHTRDISGKDLFKLIFNYSGNSAPISGIKVGASKLNSEIYISEGEDIFSYNLILREKGLEFNNQFELFQNVPNPYSNTTSIGFVLPDASNIELKVTDLAGKLVYTMQGHYPKGYNTIVLDVQQLNASGVLLYQLDTQKYSAIRKMIVIK
ncbi:MAG: T9SS type A sorting domain-containing protein [Saprospiraceae bacterium]